MIYILQLHLYMDILSRGRILAELTAQDRLLLTDLADLRASEYRDYVGDLEAFSEVDMCLVSPYPGPGPWRSRTS